jgi:hypothetical protein
VEAEAAPNRSVAFGLNSSAQSLAASKHADAAAITERNTALQARWAEFLKNLSDRRAQLLASQKSANETDELFLAFAEKGKCCRCCGCRGAQRAWVARLTDASLALGLPATAFASWTDSAHDDLEEEIAPESIEEVASLQATHNAFLAKCKEMEAERAQIAAVDAQITGKNLGANPYTPLTMQGLNTDFDDVQKLAKVRRRAALLVPCVSWDWDRSRPIVLVRCALQERSDKLQMEAERQKQLDDLKRQFADKANTLAKWLGEVRAKMTEDRATLEEQLTVVQMKHAELEKKAPEVRGHAGVPSTPPGCSPG